MRRLSRIAVFLGKVGVTAAALWFAFRHVDYSRIVQELFAADSDLLLLAVIVLGFQPLIGALRWYIVMSRLGAPISASQSVSLTYLSTFLNQVLPGGVGGDAVRMWLTFREGHHLSHALNGVALDRILGFVTLLAGASLCVIALRGYPALRILEILLLSLALATMTGLAGVMMLDRLPLSLHRLRPVRALGYLARDARKILFSIGTAPLVLGLAVLGNANLCVSLLLFMHAFNVPLDPWLLAACIAPVILASALPISVGGWGTREAAAVAIMAALSVRAEPAIMASIAFGLSGLLISLPGALFLYRSMSLRRDSATHGTPPDLEPEGRKQ